MVCFTRDDVLEDGVNVWYGEETPSFKPKFDLFLLHGLGSHPYYSWLHEPSPRLNRSSSAPGFFDSTVTLIPSGYKFLRPSATSEDAHERALLLSSPDLTWQNEYSATDFFGRIGTFWPRDLLQLDVPDVRICTVGYRSQWISSKFRTSFKECGEHLLKTIKEARTSKDAQTRPIIFIAHSFGGLVVQSALVSARIDERFSPISRLTSGCLFLGCPFQGTSAVALLSMATTLSGNPQEILDSLRPGNQHLQTLQDQFSKGYPDLPVVCFYEKIKTGIGMALLATLEKLFTSFSCDKISCSLSCLVFSFVIALVGLINIQVVSQEAACIPGAKRVGFEKDHVSMNKFKSPNDESYVLLLAELKAMMQLRNHEKVTKRGTRHLHRRNGGHIRTHVNRIVKKHISKSADLRMSKNPQTDETCSEYPPFIVSTADHETTQSRAQSTTQISSTNDATTVSKTISVRSAAIINSVPMRKSSFACVGAPSTNMPGVQNYDSRQHRKAMAHAPSNLYAPVNDHAQWITAASDSMFIPRNPPTHLLQSYQNLQLQGTPSFASQQAKRMPFRQSLALYNDSGTGHIVELATGCAVERGSGVARTARIQDSNMANPLVRHQREATSPLRYVKEIDPEMEEVYCTALSTTRKSTLDKLMPTKTSPLPKSRVALTGPLGIGKTFVASACIWRLMQQFPQLPAFWLSAETDSQLQRDCEAITTLVGLKQPKSSIEPLEWAVDISSQLSKLLMGTWLLVVDSVCGSEKGRTLISRLDSSMGRDGYMLFTTRHIGLVQTLLGGRGLSVSVGSLEPCYAADLLAGDNPSRHAGIFDVLAQLLEYNSFAVVNVAAFLRITRIPCADFVMLLELALDQDNWAADGIATKAAREIPVKQDVEHINPKTLQSSNSNLVAVMRSCIDPSWFMVFDQLYEDQPAAAELLGMLSVLGRKLIPRPLVHTSAAASSSVDVLLRQSLLKLDGNDLKAKKLTLIAHRMWLISRKELGRSFSAALRIVAFEYPDCSMVERPEKCEQMEPFAEAATSEAAKSWSSGDDNSKWCRDLLDYKREKFHRLGRKPE